MITLITIVLLAVALAYYLSFLWTVWIGLQTRDTPSIDNAPFVSVVVATRNEGQNILGCLQSLSQQLYRGRYEILIVDDHSDDRTLEVARSIAVGMVEPNITVLSLRNHGQAYGKPAAIAAGITHAKGELILCTDADCIVPAGWLASMVRCFAPQVAFVAGPVIEVPTGSLTSRLQALEFLGLITTGAGLIGSGNPIICNGANIAYRKSAYREVSGYEKESTSCDDETLMQRMVTRKTGDVLFSFDSGALVLTPTPNALAAFWNQRTRWASKRGHYEDKKILVRLIALYGFFLILFLSSGLALFDSSLFLPLTITLVLKAVAELIVLKTGARAFAQRIHALEFLIAELLHVPYIVLAALVGQFSFLRWKNRKLER